MTLSDDDKQYIQDLMKQQKKELNAEAKSSQKQLQTEHQKYITVLEQKQAKGNLTIAQSVELLKHQLHETIAQNKVIKAGQEALTRTVNAGKEVTKGGVKSVQGAGQMTSGLATLLLKSNPLTGMLVKRQSAMGALSDVGQGFGNIFKGIGQGAIGGIKALLGIKKETKKEPTKPKDGPNVVINKLTAGKIVSEKNKNSDIIPTTEQPQSLMMKVVKNGLKGLQDGIDTANKLAREVGKNHKKIILGLLMGVAAVAALAWAVKNLNLGGLAESIAKSVLNFMNEKTDVDPNLNPEGKKLKDTILTSGLTGDDAKAYWTQKAEAGEMTGIAKTNKYQKMTPKDIFGRQKATNINIYDTGNYTPILAPFDCVVMELMVHRESTNKDKYWFTMIISPAKQYKMMNGTIEYDKDAKSKWVKISRLIDPQADVKDYVPKGRLLGFADGSLRMEDYEPGGTGMSMVGDYQSYINQQKATNFKDAINNTADAKTPEYTEKLKSHLVDIVGDTHYKDKLDAASGKGWWANTKPVLQYGANKVLKAVDDEYVDKNFNEIAPKQIKPNSNSENRTEPSVTYTETQPGQKTEQADNQSQQLNAPPQQTNSEAKPDKTSSVEDKSQIIAMAPTSDSSNTPYANFMNTQQLSDACSDYQDIQAV